MDSDHAAAGGQEFPMKHQAPNEPRHSHHHHHGHYDGSGTGRMLNMGELPESLGFLLGLAQHHVVRDFDIAFAEMGIGPRLYSIMLLVQENPGCHQTDIGGALDVLQTNLVKLIDALVERGLITRKPDPEDRRANCLWLTAEGARFVKRAQALQEPLTAALVKRLGEANHAQLTALLRMLIGFDMHAPAADSGA